VFFHQGAPRLGEGALRTERSLAALRAAAVTHLSPAGQLQVATALDMLAAVEARMDTLRRQLREAARRLTGARVLADRLYGVGPLAALAMTCWLGGAGRFSCENPEAPRRERIWLGARPMSRRDLGDRQRWLEA
jgi:hypothetical protein